MYYVSIAATQNIKERVIQVYADNQKASTGDYITFFAKLPTLQVTVFESSKKCTILFASEKSQTALDAARLFDSSARITETKKRIETAFRHHQPQIGSDEVGAGDFFGPLVVAACYYDEVTVHFLNTQEIRIDDSKKITDAYILSVIPKLLPHLQYHVRIIDPMQYRAYMEKYNCKQLTALLHNFCLGNVQKQVKKTIPCYIDQFAEPNTYYRYLNNQTVTQPCTFQVKGESVYPSIALASMLARYHFLVAWQQMEKTAGLTIPKGCSPRTITVAKTILNQLGEKTLQTLTKPFKTFEEITDANSR